MIGRSRLVRYKNLSCAVLPTAFHNGCCRGMAIKWRSPLTAALCWVKYFPSVLSFYVARAAVPVGFFHVAMASDKPRIGQDKWSVSHENLQGEEHAKWKELSATEKAVHILEVALKFVGILFVLYLFICSLNLLAEAFKLIGGRGLGNVINNSSLIQNPISAAIIGMVVTLILQSSSTLMSVMVGMVAGNLITVHNAIPVMMGAEMGSSIMNALISLTQSGDPQQFRRAFAAATMNDVYNVCCVFTILPMEVAF
uniref:Na_Ca_ex domain-containing protein n=1 Tax=Steinernema glaseri TaxID=37863 RepID=A0A1I7ZXN9_9BILA